MIKTLITGIWISAVTLGSSYTVLTWRLNAMQAGNEAQPAGLEYVKPKTINVPVIVNGTVQGYVLAQFVFTVDGKLARQMSVPPEMFLLDEAFKAVYGSPVTDFQKLRQQDLDTLAKTIAESANRRFGIRLVHDVLIQELNYLPKERTRAGEKP